MVVPKSRLLKIVYWFSIFFPFVSFGQGTLLGKEAEDTTSLKYKILNEGHFHLHARSFFMATDNRAPLTDYYAWAFGAGLGYESFKMHGFQFGLTGYFIFNLASSDLGKVDSLAKTGNRYEIGLFDISNPKNTSDLDRLEDLYIRYHYRKSKVELGRFELNTPFLNRQDGRMRGTIEEGAWLELNEIKNIKLEAGWIWSISPRSTIRWYNVEDAYGIYPGGLNESGQKSNYAGNIQSAGIGLLGVSYQKKNVKLQVWDQFAENVFNTAFFQSEFSLPLNQSWSLKSGLMYVRQDALNDGGNSDQSKSYIARGSGSDVISIKAGFGTDKFETSINYTGIPGEHRFLMPREWGREPFYTFMPRERNEGFAELNAIVLRTSLSFFKGALITSLGYGHFYLPDVKNAAINKYGLPSYKQLNLEARYSFRGYLKGMSALFLFIYKGDLGETYGEYKYVFNKVDMFNWNLMIDYSF